MTSENVGELREALGHRLQVVRAEGSCLLHEPSWEATTQRGDHERPPLLVPFLYYHIRNLPNAAYDLDRPLPRADSSSAGHRFSQARLTRKIGFSPTP